MFLQLAMLPTGSSLSSTSQSSQNLTPGLTGGASLDHLMLQYQVEDYSPLFDMSRGDRILKERLGMDRVYMLTLPAGQDLPQALSDFAADPAVVYAEPDYTGTGGLIPNDSSFATQWSLQNTGQSGGEVDADIDATEAWDVTTGLSSVVIAVIDTGIDLDHPDLAGKFVAGYDYANGDSNPQDDHGHGTHVAGIAAAKSNNSTGIAGVCMNCSLMPLKALDENNWGYYSWWSSAIEYAVDHGADVINMSMGGDSYSSSLHDAVKYAYNAGVPLTAAMMNAGNSTVFYPAGFSEAISIGSTNRYDERASSSCFGNHIDLVAPGDSIYSTMLNDTYATWSGTSMATPHVSGTIGLVQTVHPGYTVEQIRNLLRDLADDQVGNPTQDTPGWDIYYGAGRLNSAKALRKAAGWLLGGVTISGPISGELDRSYTFDALASPSTSSVPVSYEWQVDGGTPVSHSGGLTDFLTQSWSTTGVKTIHLTASNAWSSVQAEHSYHHQRALRPTDEFHRHAAHRPAPWQVRFSNTTSGTYASSNWDFGDGGSSSEENPSHVYDTPGLYTVTLTVNGSMGKAR